MKRVLCIWLPNWPIQRLVVTRPELNDQAILLYARQGNRGQRVTACSSAAQAVGVRHEMPLAEATMLLRESRPASRRQPRAAACFHTESYDSALDRRELVRLAEWCERFSPIVGLDPSGDVSRGEPVEPEGLVLDVTGLGPLFRGEEALSWRVVTELAACGYLARVAVGDTLGAAWGMARFAHECPPANTLPCWTSPIQPGAAEPAAPAGRQSRSAQSRSAQSRSAQSRSAQSRSAQSRSATAALPPRAGAWVIPPGQAAASIGPLPLEALRLPPALIALLRQLGIHSTGELLRLPRSGLSSRWGDAALLRIDQALGSVGEPILAHHAPPAYEATWSLEYPTERRDTVEFVVEQLITRVAHLLAERNRGAVRLEIRLRCTDSRERTFRVDLFRPTAVARHLAELARLQFDQTTWSAAIQQITVRAPLTAPLAIRQGELFDEAVRDGQKGVAMLVDRLSSRLGREGVLQPRPMADAQPERACRYTPWAGRPPRKRRGMPESQFRSPHRPADRPLHLRHPPLALQVLAATRDGPPTRFQLQHRWHAIVRYWGPERIETGWWRGQTVRRDYYRVETDRGQWFWIFRQLDDGQWFLHGEW